MLADLGQTSRLKSKEKQGYLARVLTMFFFSSRRRHTRSLRDWSSDVCSSDLGDIKLDRNAADGAEVTHFKITGITNGSLFQHNGTTPINNGDFVTVAEAQAGLRFTPGNNRSEERRVGKECRSRWSSEQ